MPTLRFEIALVCALSLTACFNSNETTPTEPAPRTRVVVGGYVRSVEGAPVNGARVTLRKSSGSACVPTAYAGGLGGHPWLLIVASPPGLPARLVSAPDAPVCSTWGDNDVLTDASGRYEIRIDLSGTASTSCASGTIMSVEVAGFFMIEEQVALSCHSQLQTVDFEMHRAVVPVLLAPTTSDSIAQNLSLGNCSGYEVRFDWTDIEVPLATTQYRYRIQIQRAGLVSGTLDLPVGESEYLFRFCGFVPDQELEGMYQWRVRGEAPGRVGPWTELRPLSFAPCKRPNGSRCEDPE